MAVIVSLSDVIEQMDLTTDEATAYINRKTGELITLTDEEVALTEDPDEAEAAPQWQKDLLPKAREVMAVGGLYPLAEQVRDSRVVDHGTLCPISYGCRCE